MIASHLRMDHANTKIVFQSVPFPDLCKFEKNIIHPPIFSKYRWEMPEISSRLDFASWNGLQSEKSPFNGPQSEKSSFSISKTKVWTRHVPEKAFSVYVVLHNRALIIEKRCIQPKRYLYIWKRFIQPKRDLYSRKEIYTSENKFISEKRFIQPKTGNGFIQTKRTHLVHRKSDRDHPLRDLIRTPTFSTSRLRDGFYDRRHLWCPYNNYDWDSGYYTDDKRELYSQSSQLRGQYFLVVFYTQLGAFSQDWRAPIQISPGSRWLFLCFSGDNHYEGGNERTRQERLSR